MCLNPTSADFEPLLATLHAKEHDVGDEQQRRCCHAAACRADGGAVQRWCRDAVACRADARWAGSDATPDTALRGSDDVVGPMRIPFRVEKKGQSPNVPGKVDDNHGRGKGVVNAETAASAHSSTQDNTVRVADVLRHLAVQGTELPVGGKGTAQHWVAGVALVVSGGLGMPGVHGRQAVKDLTAAANCDHAHVRVVTARDVYFSCDLLGDVLEQGLLAVRQDVIDSLSPPDGDGSRCRLRHLKAKPKVKCIYPSTYAVHESDEKCKRLGSATLVAVDKGVVSAAGGPCELEDDGVICSAGYVR